jgi:serine/threonine-protein kinase
VQESYELMRLLGRGGFGQVYLARYLGEAGFQKEVALKFLNEKTSDDQRLLASLRDEARLLGLLRHRNIVHVDRLIRLRGSWVIVMEYVPGVDLLSLIRQGALPVGVTMEVVSEVAAALSAAFGRTGPDGTPLKLTHCDIKPGNIRITQFGEVKVLDFGIAQAEFAGREGVDQKLSGTPRYMSPESFDGSSSPASDIYSLGMLAFEAVTAKRLPVIRLDVDTHFYRIQQATQVLTEHRVEASVSSLILQMLSFRPEERPSPSTVHHQARRLAVTLGQSLAEWLSERTDMPTVDAPGEEPMGLTLVLGAHDHPSVTTGHLAHPSAPETALALSELHSRAPVNADPPITGSESSWRSTLSSVQLHAGPDPWLRSVLIGVGLVLLLTISVFCVSLLTGPSGSAPQQGPPIIQAPVFTADETPAPALEEEHPIEPPTPASPATEAPPPATPAPRKRRAAKPQPRPPESVRVIVTGDGTRVALHGDGEKYPIPGRVPPGSYTIWAAFWGESYSKRGTVTVAKDTAAIINCDSTFRTCVKR